VEVTLFTGSDRLVPRLVRLSPDLWTIQTINLLTHALTAPAPNSVPANPGAMQRPSFLLSVEKIGAHPAV